MEETTCGKRLGLLKISILVNLIILAPTVGICFCFLTTYIFDFHEMQENSCKVEIYLPSISSACAIVPQIYIFRFFMAIPTGPRLIFAYMYYCYFLDLNIKSRKPSKFRKTVAISGFFCNIVELVSLAGLTYISDKENYSVHEKFYTCFLVFSFMYMFQMLYLMKVLHPNMEQSMIQSFRLKLFAVGTSVLVLPGMIVFYLWHKLYCLETSYSWFALCEYIITFCNVCFHWTISLDFPATRLVITDS